MWTPEPDKDGNRRYQQWAGDPAGRKEDKTRCVSTVVGDRFSHAPQCSRPRGHGPDGLYCKQHAKRLSRL